jgi:S-methylmethionine-dependent homocysteine/selenocysteine methylase
MSEQLILTDGGLETTLVFHEGVELPHFAAFPLLDSPAGRELLRRYFAPFFDVAREHSAAFQLDTPTWRANRDWGGRLGYDRAALDRVNRDAVTFARTLAAEAAGVDVRVNGVVGPRGDGYVVDERMSSDEARAYHRDQVASLATGGADMVSAITMTYPDEAIGFARAAADAGVPAVVSFTVETDGRLPDGSMLGDAIEAVDAATDGPIKGFMVNCAHPSHFEHVLQEGGTWRERITGLRANASRMSHEQLDAAEELDAGDPEDLAHRYVVVSEDLPRLTTLGGCCGTDRRLVAAIASAWRDAGVRATRP